METAEYDLMDAAEERMWWYRAVHARLLDALAARPGVSGLPVLDAGCGTGGFLRRLMEAVPWRRGMGLEWNPAAAARAAAKAGVPVVSGDVNALPFGDGAFGAAVSVDVLCHRAVEEAAALAGLFRVIAPGGALVLNLPAFEWLRSAHDERVHTARRYTAAGARAAVEAAGFRDVGARYWNGVLLPLMAVQRKVLSRGEAAASDVADFPPWMDRAFHAATEMERRLPFRMLAGGSVMVVATRP